jgi:precorrin-2 methylase
VSWIDDRIEEKRLLEEHKQVAFVKAGSLFQALWDEIARCATEAAQKGIPAATSMAAGTHVVYLSSPPKAGAARKEIALTLAKDRTSIVITGSAVKKLEIALSQGDSVCLKHDGKQISVPEAAILLLDPFLFEGLPARPAGGPPPPDPDFIR